jgi:hypothetical protein
MGNGSYLKWFFIWTLVYAFTLAIMSVILAEFQVYNPLWQVFLTGLGLAIVASFMNKHKLVINKWFFIWAAVLSFSFWLVGFILTKFDIVSPLFYLFLMGLGIEALSKIFQNIHASSSGKVVIAIVLVLVLLYNYSAFDPFINGVEGGIIDISPSPEKKYQEFIPTIDNWEGSTLSSWSEVNFLGVWKNSKSFGSDTYLKFGNQKKGLIWNDYGVVELEWSLVNSEIMRLVDNSPKWALNSKTKSFIDDTETPNKEYKFMGETRLIIGGKEWIKVAEEEKIESPVHKNPKIIYSNPVHVVHWWD